MRAYSRLCPSHSCMLHNHNHTMSDHASLYDRVTYLLMTYQPTYLSRPAALTYLSVHFSLPANLALQSVKQRLQNSCASWCLRVRTLRLPLCVRSGPFPFGVCLLVSAAAAAASLSAQTEQRLSYLSSPIGIAAQFSGGLGPQGWKLVGPVVVSWM